MAAVFVCSSIGVAASSMGAPAEIARLGLTEQVAFSSTKLVQKVHYSADLTKVFFLGRKSDLSAKAKADLPEHIGAWTLTVSPTKDFLLFSKGLEDEELKQLMKYYHQHWTARWVKDFVMHEAQAATSESFQCGRESQNRLPSAVQDILKNVSVSEAVRNCNFDLEAMIKNAIQSAIDTYTSLDLLSLSKLSKVWDTIQYAITDLTKDLAKTFARLGANASKIIEGLICNVLKDHAASLVMASVLPGGAKQIPLEIEKIVERLAEFANAPVMLNLIEKGAFNPSFLQYERVLTRLTETVPEAFKSIRFTEKNFAEHYEKHRFEFKDIQSAADYERKMRDFSTASGPHIVHKCLPKKDCSKMNVETGEYLIVSSKGHLVTYYKIRGKSSEDRFRQFLVKEEKHLPKTQ